jgi:fatty acid desaturase
MQELHPIGWYAQRVAPHLPKEAFKPVPQRLWGGLAFLLLTASSIVTIGLADLPWYANLALSFLVGTGFAGLGFLGHEILHGTVVKNARLRDFLGAIAFAQFNLGPKLWRKWHNMEHHAHTQEDHIDPDAWATMEELYRRPFMRWVYRLPFWVRSLANFTSFTLFFTIHGALMFKRYVGDFKPRDRAMVRFQLIWPIALWLSLLVWLGPYKWLFAYVLPLMMANFLVISYIATNHQLNPLTEVNDPLANSLTVTVPRWVDVLHLNFSYHTEHHLFPGMNPKWGPLVKAEIKRQWPDRYHEMPFTLALATLWRTPRVYSTNFVDLVDPDKGMAYGTLGHGLQPSAVRPRPVVLNADTEVGGSLPTPQEGD